MSNKIIEVQNIKVKIPSNSTGLEKVQDFIHLH